MKPLRAESGLSEPLFFGLIEVASFVYLFLTPWLASSIVECGWSALVLWRIVALSSLFYFQQSIKVLAYSSWDLAKDRLTLLGRGVLYGLPFWCSSLLFPLTHEQTGAVFPALLLYLKLLLLSFALSNLNTLWLPGFVGVLTFLWFNQDELYALYSWALLLLPLVISFWPRKRVFIPVDMGSIRLLSFLAAMSWAFCLYLAKSQYGLGELHSFALLYWLLSVMIASDLLSSARSDAAARSARAELEFGLPGLHLALEWVYGRRLIRNWGAWLVALGLCLLDTETWVLLSILIVVLPGLVKLAGRGVQADTLQWWVCWQFLLFWGVAESLASARFFWIAPAFLSSVYLYRTKVSCPESGELELCRCQGPLELLLRRELVQSAPPNFKDAILDKVELSVDIDESLTSSAPLGFRERLLERLRRDVPDEE